MKTSKKTLFEEIATSVGRTAGKVEGEVETIREASRKEPESDHPDTHFESSDFSQRGVFWTGVGVFVGIWIVTGVLYFVLHAFSQDAARQSPPPLPVAGTPEALPPQPRLQQSPHDDLKRMRAREDWELTHYYWIDKSRGNLAIPIEQAIKLTAQRGIPPTNLAPNPTQTPPVEGSRLTGFEGKVEPEPR